MLQAEYGDPILTQIGLGHDLFENTRVNAQYLRDRGFSERTIDGIWGMTKREGQTRGQYRTQVNASLDCVRAKRMDVKHNADTRRYALAGRDITPQVLRRTEVYLQYYRKLERKEQQMVAALEAERIAKEDTIKEKAIEVESISDCPSMG
jgi:hypothetical protein